MFFNSMFFKRTDSVSKINKLSVVSPLIFRNIKKKYNFLFNVLILIIFSALLVFFKPVCAQDNRIPLKQTRIFKGAKFIADNNVNGVTIEVNASNDEGYSAFISARGALITKFLLNGKRYKNDKPFIDNKSVINGITGIGGISLSNQVFPGELSSAIWSINPESISENEVKVSLSYKLKDLYPTPGGEMKNPLAGLEITKIFVFKAGSFNYSMEVQIKNITNNTIAVMNSSNQLGFAVSVGGSIAGDQVDDKTIILSNGKVTDRDAADFIKNPRLDIVSTGHTIDWAAIRDRYFSVVVIPDRKVKHGVVSGGMDLNEKRQSMAGLAYEGFELTGGESKNFKFNFYAGPKERSRLKKNGIGKIFEPGFWSLKLAVIEVLSFFYKYTKSWGWAIVILTIFLKIVLYPLMVKQTKSMHVMQKLQPEIKKLQEKYASDSKKMNQEMMELYKKNNANPFGGCFPLLIQLPILYALFSALQESVEIKGASFFWLADLSLPDKNILIPGTALAFPLLPLIIAISMHYQQKSMSADPKQAKMMAFMPIMMFFICQALPSGVLIYWLVSNVLSMWQQERIKASLETVNSGSKAVQKNSVQKKPAALLTENSAKDDKSSKKKTKKKK